MATSPHAEARSTLRSAADLSDRGLIDPARLPGLAAVAARYAVAITPAVAALIDPADPADPIARQFLPDEAELNLGGDEDADPTGDRAHSPVEGIVHRYPDRVLLKPTYTCAVYCRFCFRREVVGPSGQRSLSPAALDKAMRYIAADSEIWEVIVTGGDPFVLSARRLADLMRRLAAIAHVKVVRFHTRVPVVAPDLVNEARIAALRGSAQAVYVAVHVNHARELTAPARAACARLVDAGVPLVSQSVLLRGVNDDAETLGALMRGLVETRIKPYYLHHGDLAPGTGHLRTTVEEGQGLMRALRGRLSGLCQPTYVLDIPGGYGKSPIGPVYLDCSPDGLAIEDRFGHRHRYPPGRPDPAARIIVERAALIRSAVSSSRAEADVMSPSHRPQSDEIQAEQQPYPARQAAMQRQPQTDFADYRAAGKLDGKRALITGADSGIGRAVAIAFAMEGAAVAVLYNENDEDAEETRRLVEARGGRCELYKSDVRDRRKCFDVVDRVVAAFGGLDILVNNASYQMSQPSFLDITEEQLRRTFETNIFGYVFMAQAALPHLESSRGCIVNSGSIVGLTGQEILIDYASSKGAIHAFTRSLATALGPKGVRVNAVLPGPVWTPNIVGTLPADEIANFGHEVALARPGQPDELAPAYVLLASSDGSFMTGALVQVTGGKLSTDS